MVNFELCKGAVRTFLALTVGAAALAACGDPEYTDKKVTEVIDLRDVEGCPVGEQIRLGGNEEVIAMQVAKREETTEEYYTVHSIDNTNRRFLIRNPVDLIVQVPGEPKERIGQYGMFDRAIVAVSGEIVMETNQSGADECQLVVERMQTVEG